MKLEGQTFTSTEQPILGAAETHTGLARTNNEDYFGQDPERGIFIVTDGLGGHNAGETASRLAVESLLDFYRSRTSLDAGADEEAIEHAHQTIKRASQEDPRFHGMGTTLVMMRYTGAGMRLYSVGDSSIYLFRNGELIKLLREEASGLAGLLSHIIPSPLAGSHIVSCALGPSLTLDIVSEYVEAVPGDIFLLCTDGLTNMVNEREIETVLHSHNHDLQACCQKLIEDANAAGGLDNITGMLVKVSGEDSQSPFGM